MARGGRRVGRTGQAYSNRTDLTNAPAPLPIAAPTGQPYGAAAQQLAAQKAVPMASGPVINPTPPPNPAVPPAGGPPPVVPGSLPPLDRASERPTEPLTHGAPVGPGAGPEILGSGSLSTLADAISAAAMASGSSDLQFLADRARQMGQ